MRRFDTISPILRSGISGKSSSNNHPFSYFCATFLCVGSHEEEENPISPKPRFDFCCIRELDDAVNMFHEMVRVRPRPSVRVFANLMSVVVKMKHYYAALQMFDQICHLVVINEYTMSIAINCYCLLNRVDLGFSILGRFFKLGHEPNIVTYNTLIKGLFLGDKVYDAVEVFKKLLRKKLCEPDEFTFLAVIDGLCKAGYTLMALDLLGVLVKGSYKPDAYSYNTIIDSLCKDVMIDDALKLFCQMIEKGINPDIFTYSSLIQGLCNFGRWKEVIDFLNVMQDDGICPNLVTFNILVDAFCKNGMVDEAGDLLKTMKQRNISLDIFTYNALIDGYCLRGEIDRAGKLFDSLANMGLKPCIISYNNMINGYFRKGKVDEARNLFYEISSKGLEPTTITCNAMLQGLFRAGRFDDGWKLFNEMKVQKVCQNIVTFNILLDSLCKSRQFTQAFSFLQIMEEKGISPNIVTYNILIDSLCNDGKHDIARNIFCELPSKGSKRDFITYISSLCQEGFVKEAKKMLIDMEEGGCIPNTRTFNIFIHGALRRNDFYEAMSFLDEMHRRGFSADLTTMSMLLHKSVEYQDEVLKDMIKRIVPEN